MAAFSPAADMEAISMRISQYGITLIDLVARQSLSVREGAQNPSTSFDALVEEIDIGGPSMVRAAAKNFEGVLVVVSPSDYDTVLAQLDRPSGHHGSSASSWPAKPLRTPEPTTRRSRRSSTRSGSPARFRARRDADVSLVDHPRPSQAG
jgi:hypothetical protein